jgi:NAD(P)-dependent dehydrogenase (short-subunit alcohol dehydrogenase family)
MKDFAGKTAVVTGAAGGIGRALAEKCAALGMNVVLADIEGGALQETTKAIEASGARAIGVVTDVARADALSNLAEKTLDAFGGAHLLCNNAGVFAAGGAIWETPLADFEWQFGVNAMGIVHGLRAFVPIMLEQGGDAHIVNTASMAAVTTSPMSSGYYSSKHAALSMSEALYHELTQQGSKIGVSVLCPELVDTRIGDAERNRPPTLKREDDGEEHPERELIQQALRQFTATGVPPSVMADRVFEAIRENRFYILSPAGAGWRRACEARLDDIRNEQNPRFIQTTTNE